MNTSHKETTTLTNLASDKEFFISCPSECEELLVSRDKRSTKSTWIKTKNGEAK